ncbi:uncharacterized protein LOC123314061 [Coccinella septempunctata]|uniref:uncharacterized protein LOC123314061 n=1 Tax=Coccinella septempunctata TaxID=41139 RepID=UPI001D085C5E|nr:uncharacterized protein LOC123314061 [Coccinella septempunctata]
MANQSEYSYEEYMRVRRGGDSYETNCSERTTTTNIGNSEVMSVTENVTNMEELQATIRNVNTLAASINWSDVQSNKTTTGLLKEVVNILGKVHQNMLESEREKLSRKQNSEHRAALQSQRVASHLPQESPSCSNSAPKIQRQYKLTSKSSFEVWIDSLNTELISWGLLDLIDPSQPGPAEISESETRLRKNSVKDIIINHLDEEYHKRILGLTEPRDILKKLKESRKGEVSSTPTSIRTRLYNLRMNKDERVHKFCERFDQIIREHELSDDPQKLTEQEMRSTFYQAIIGAMPEVRRTDSAVISTTGKEMDMESLRKTMYRIQEDNDANRGSYSENEVAASRARVLKGKFKENKCFRCNRKGHWQDQCPFRGTNQWFCYSCNDITDHTSENCYRNSKRPYKSSNHEPPVKRFKTNQGQELRDRGSGKFRGRGGNPTTSNSRGNSRGNTRGHFRGRGSNRGMRHHSVARRADYKGSNERYEEDSELQVDNEFSGQSQTNNIEISEETNSESIENVAVDVGSAIGRESLDKPIVSDNSENSNSEKSSLDKPIVSENSNSEYKIVKIDDLKSLESLKDTIDKNPPENMVSTNIQSEAMLWHQRLGHASLNYLKMIQKRDKRLENVKFDDSIRECAVCILAKMEKLPFKQIRSRADRPLQLIHSDVMGPIKPNSWPGHKRYIIVFVDDYSRYANIYCLKSKDESGQAFDKFLISARNLLGADAKVCYVRSSVRSDRGTEFTGGNFAEILKREKIESDSGPPYTPELNGTAERFNKSIQRTIRAFMCDSGLPQSMWELAAETAVHTYNRTPHKSIGYEVPLIKFSPRANCHLEHIRRFGCVAYVKLPFVETKFSNVSIKTILVGHTPTGYILWHPSTRKFIESRHVRFIERLVYKDAYLKNQSKELSVESTSEKTMGQLSIRHDLSHEGLKIKMFMGLKKHMLRCQGCP